MKKKQKKKQTRNIKSSDEKDELSENSRNNRRNSKKLFLCIYKMFNISVQNYKNAQVYTITVPNRELFWVRMINVQKGSGVKNMSDLVRKEIHGIFETKNPTKEQIKKNKRSEKETDKKSKSDSKLKYIRSDLMSRIMKNCRGEKKRGKKNR